MAERRVAFRNATPIPLRLDEDWLPAALSQIPSVWLVQDAGGLVGQPFFAALDPVGHLCWTDDRDRAEQFGAKQAADRFALDRMTSAVRLVRVPTRVRNSH